MPNSGLNETAERPIPELPVVGLRRLTYADLPVVISIERRSFTSPWSPGMFVLEMSKASTIALAAVQSDDRPIGYAVFSRYDAAWHMMNVAVAPEHRRRRIASTLIEGALSRIGPTDPVTLEVRPSNHAAIALYQAFGFTTDGHRKAYYSNGEDAIIMWRGDPALAGVPSQASTER